MNFKSSVPLQAILLSVVVHALWGGNPIGGKFGLMAFPPYWSAFIRFVFGIATIVLWCRIRGHRIWPATHEWRPIMGIGLLFTVQIGLMNMGFDRTSGVNASILISTNPLFAVLFAYLLIGTDRLGGRRLVGLLVAFSGVCLTLWEPDSGGVAKGRLLASSGDWLCLASAAMLGFRLIASAKAMQRLDSFRLAIWQMVFSLPLFALAGGLFETILWDQLAWAPVLGLAYQGVVVAGIGFMVTLWLIGRYQPSVMVSFGFIAPVTGVLLAAALLGESLSANALIGVACLAVGMILIHSRAA